MQCNSCSCNSAVTRHYKNRWTSSGNTQQWTHATIISFLGYEWAETESHCLIGPNGTVPWNNFVCTLYYLLDEHGCPANVSSYKNLQVTRGTKLNIMIHHRWKDKWSLSYCLFWNWIMQITSAKYHYTRNSHFFYNMHNIKLVLTRYKTATLI